MTQLAGQLLASCVMLLRSCT